MQKLRCIKETLRNSTSYNMDDSAALLPLQITCMQICQFACQAGAFQQTMHFNKPCDWLKRRFSPLVFSPLGLFHAGFFPAGIDFFNFEKF